MMPGDSQFPNPNPPRPPMPPGSMVKPRPFPEPRAGINPVKPGVGSKSQDMKKKDMLKRDMLKKSGPGKPAPSTGKTTVPMKPGIKTKNAPMPYNKNKTKNLGYGN
jgi:hypothetical protein